ncbi:hypothetical protein FE257_003918 [Aspergillus nanangensis]|uniref:Xylanolytic transcriptional activator regulatory domain-containing protein n=1 Tax=Aspergillus nanangensis TaxID=2582783 RepID=A0AAD4CTH5_ASPNN|nr:hypothetical protein FE257_003918 [Aspergillus nanangensis]
MNDRQQDLDRQLSRLEYLVQSSLEKKGATSGTLNLRYPQQPLPQRSNEHQAKQTWISRDPDPVDDTTPVNGSFKFLSRYSDKTANGNISNRFSGDIFPSPSQVFLLWEVFKENVAPVVPIIHKPSFEAYLMEMAATPEKMDLNRKALLLVVFLSTVISMTDEECVRDLDDTRPQLLTTYKEAITSIFSRMRVLETRNLTLLQAFVLYLSCTRKYLEETSYVWAMTTVALRLARNMNLHRDGASIGMDPFETEMRRRIWWHICFLDVQCSEHQGTESDVLDMCFDTHLPSNVNDDDIMPRAAQPIKEQMAVTEMTYAIVRYEAILEVRRMRESMNTSQQYLPVSDIGYCEGKWRQAVQNLSQRLWVGYVSHCDPTNPTNQLYIGLARVVPKMAFIIHQPIMRSIPVQTDALDWNFSSAVEALEFCRFLDYSPETIKWKWHFRQSSGRCYILTLLLAELCVRPPCPLVERAWLAIRSAYKEWAMVASVNEMTAISKLMQRALSLRGPQ